MEKRDENIGIIKLSNGEVEEMDLNEVKVLFSPREFNFINIMFKRRETEHRKNDTKEKVFEFEFYDILFRLLDVVDAFEGDRRKPLIRRDYYELLSKLEWCYNTLKNNIAYLESD